MKVECENVNQYYSDELVFDKKSIKEPHDGVKSKR